MNKTICMMIICSLMSSCGKDKKDGTPDLQGPNKDEVKVIVDPKKEFAEKRCEFMKKMKTIQKKHVDWYIKVNNDYYIRNIINKEVNRLLQESIRGILLFGLNNDMYDKRNEDGDLPCTIDNETYSLAYWSLSIAAAGSTYGNKYFGKAGIATGEHYKEHYFEISDKMREISRALEEGMRDETAKLDLNNNDEVIAFFDKYMDLISEIDVTTGY